MGKFKSQTPSEDQWEQFFGELLPKDKAESWKSTNEIDRICVFCRHFFDFEVNTVCALYYIDLSSCKDKKSSVRSLQPILQFEDTTETLCFQTFVVVGSKLFMFGWSDDHDQFRTRKWCFYDFSWLLYSAKTTNVKVEDFERGSSMLEGRKYNPIAAVVGGFKVCFFATTLFDSLWNEKKYNELCETPNFEVLDTRNMTWTKLPEPFIYSECQYMELCITSYCVEGSCLIICTSAGIYGIDIDAADLKWVKMERSGWVKWGPFRGEWTTVGRNVCNAYEVSRWGESRSYPFAERASVKCGGYAAMCCKRDDKGGAVLCRVTNTFKEAGTPVLLVNVFKFGTESVENVRGDMWKTIKSEKCVSYELESRKCELLDIRGCFEFQELEKATSGVGLLLLEDNAVKRAVQKKASCRAVVSGRFLSIKHRA